MVNVYAISLVLRAFIRWMKYKWRKHFKISCDIFYAQHCSVQYQNYLKLVDDVKKLLLKISNAVLRWAICWLVCMLWRKNILRTVNAVEFFVHGNSLNKCVSTILVVCSCYYPHSQAYISMLVMLLLYVSVHLLWNWQGRSLSPVPVSWFLSRISIREDLQYSEIFCD